MASWKEKGEVPDSDEEDDGDSHSITNEEYGNVFSQAPRDVQEKLLSGRNGGGNVLTLAYPGQPSADALKVPPIFLRDERAASEQPSLSPRIFKKPPSLLDPERLSESQQMGSQAFHHDDDEISQSYIKLFSSSSSSTCRPSLPVQTKQLDETAATNDQGSYSTRLADDDFIRHQPEDWRDEGVVETVVDDFDFSSTSRRSLRQRNPIQLHPYALEGEKYRRTLIARGMRPLRLAQVREDGRKFARAQTSLDPDFEAENESQVLNVEDEPQLSQSSQVFTSENLAILASPDHVSTPSSCDNDEFPDIDQLLDRSNEHFVQAGSKRQRITYGSRYTSRLPSGRPLPRVPRGRGPSSTSVEVLDVPPSPPATSSPVPVFQASTSDRRCKYVLLNLASSRATSLEYTQSEKVVTTGNLLTPVTDTVKHTIDLTAEDQSEDDPFVSEADSSAASSFSEPDQAMQVRRVGKKIHGVLPASWLRLDQQTRPDEKSKATSREHRSLSPVKAALFRRGVAVPKDVTLEKGPKSTHRNTDCYFMLSDSDEDVDSYLPGVVKESATDLFQESTFSQTDMCSVIEDDRVDAMLPSQMRQTKLLPGTTHRKRRPTSTSFFAKRHSGPSYQPKIIDQILKTRHSYSRSQGDRRHRIRTRGPNNPLRSIPPPRYRQTSIPKLSILDVVKSHGENRDLLPAFIRIAARNARSSKGLGRHSPTRKFIKLANRGDTQDAQSVLQDWREGTLRPRAEDPNQEQLPVIRQPLSGISKNIQGQGASTLRGESKAEIEASHVPTLPKNVIISRSSSQVKLVRSTEPRSLIAGRNGSANRTISPKKRAQAPKATTLASRPAQLETSVINYSKRYPSLAFGSTKKVLDTLYRKAHKGSKVRGDIQLARFLGNASASGNIVTAISGDETEETMISSMKKTGPAQSTRRRKRIPRRVDASAAIFRQPSEPLVLDFLQQVPEIQDEFGNNGKLLGLGNFGTSYTHHFNIFPLQSGVFFHASTLIGSGRLSKALEDFSARDFNRSQEGYVEYQLAGKRLRWGPWDNSVSSEVGMCLDWIVEQLEDSNTKVSEIDLDALIVCITHIIDYVQNYLSFPNLSLRHECILRMTEVLHSFAERLAVLADQNIQEAEMQRVFIELSCRVMILSYSFLRISQSDSRDISMASQLESLLQRTAMLTVSLLLSLGLGLIRNLYDDLQYLAYREAGIRCDRYAAQAWVTAMHIVHAAQIPRVSFWDIVNSQLIKDDGAQLSDARVLERIWYSMFSLLPLTDFDMNGILIPGVRLLRSLENWALLQRMAKKIFELYSSKSRQSPSFNDYCRALFSRCTHLMQIWGWRRHGIMVGTLFDFFATRKLAHLRNEEVYRSPRFLEELDKDTSLVVDPEDRCFHILLKIIAISIKQMRDVDDTKGIRNLVTRVLPNHDRQYPKEKTVHQRDLASLRNHHDLLCTLFWAAPPELRPPIALIRELVNPESSHQEAYLINLRSWENLSRFVLACTPTPTAYLPLAAWQNESFAQLLSQHQSAEKDIQEQLRLLPAAAKQQISQQTVAQTIQENKNQIIMSLAQNLRAMKRRMDEAKDMSAIKLVVLNVNCIKTLTDALSFFRHRHDADWPVVEAALDIIHTYVTRLNDSAPVSDVQPPSSEDDSQEYGSDVFLDVQVERLEYAGALNCEILAGVRDVLRTSLRSGVPIGTSFMEKIVDTWALIASTLILAKTHVLSDFISDSGVFNELNMDDNAYNVRYYASYFLGKLVKFIGNYFFLDNTGRDALSDWLCILIKPLAAFHFEHTLLPLFAKCEMIIADAAANFPRHRIGNKPPISTLNGIKRCRVDLIKDTLEGMNNFLQHEPSETQRYQNIVRRILAHMKFDLVNMEPGSQETIQHHKFIMEVHSQLTTFFHELCMTDLFDEYFTTNSTYPKDREAYSDLRIFIATIRNYGLRLHSDRGKNEFNHYFLAVLKYAAVVGNLGEISVSLQEAMGNELGSWIAVSQHVLTVLTPSFIHAAFVSEPGWLLAEPVLEAAQEHLMAIADYDRSGALKGVSEIMSTIVNGVALLMEAHSPDNIRAATSYELVYVLLMSTRFMTLAYDWLPFTMELCSEKEDEISSAQAAFYNFAHGAKAYLSSPLRIFVNSLKRYEVSPDGSDDRDLRAALYELAMRGIYNEEIRAQALHRLAAPFARDAEELHKIKIELKLQHNHKFISGVWLFHDMRGSGFFEQAKSLMKSPLDTEGPNFSAAILADYRQNWAEFPDNGDIEIKCGHEKRVAKGLLADGRSLKHIFEELRKALDEYIIRFEKAASRRSALRGAQRDVPRVTEDLVF